MKNYLLGIGVILAFLSINRVQSMQELNFEQMKQFQQLLRACADNPQLAGQMLGQIETARLDDEDSLDGSSIIDKARHLIEVEQQLILNKDGVMTDIINDPRYKKHKVFSLELYGIAPETPFIPQLESLINWRERLYNLRTLSLSRFDGIDEFVRRFFNHTGAGYAETGSTYFVSLVQINLASGGDISAIDGRGLRLIIDHFARYDEVVRDMVQYAVRDGAPVASIHINGVSDALLAQTDLSNYLVYKGRTVILKDSVDIFYRSGQPKLQVNFIAHLKK